MDRWVTLPGMAEMDLAQRIPQKLPNAFGLYDMLGNVYGNGAGLVRYLFQQARD